MNFFFESLLASTTVYENTVAPSIAVQGGGEPGAGSVLEVTAGTWTGAPTLTYQWYKNGVAISGQTATTYTAVSGDFPSAITVMEIPNGQTADQVESNAIELVDALVNASYVQYIVNKGLNFQAGLVNINNTLLPDSSGHGRDATVSSPVTIGPLNELIDSPSGQMVQSIDCKSGNALMMPFNGSGFATATHEIWMALRIADGQPTATYSLFGGRTGASTAAYSCFVASTGIMTVQYRDAVTGQKTAVTNAAYFANGATGYKVIRIKLDWTAKQIYIYDDSAINTPVTLNATNNGNLSAFTASNYGVTHNWLLGNINANGALNDTTTNNRYISQFQIFTRALTNDEATARLALMQYNGLYLNDDKYSFTSASELEQKRQDAVEWIWPSGLPTDLPTNWTSHTTDTYIDHSGFTNLASVEKGEISTGNNGKIILYKINPTTDNDRIICIPAGHGDTWTEIGDTVSGGNVPLALEYFNNLGYTVLTWYMAARGPNTAPFGVTGGSSTSHDDMSSVESYVPYIHPFSHFLTASIVAVNYAESLGYTKISFTGISGGAWTTVWASFLLGSRIHFVFPANGWYPNFILEIYDNGSADYEQGYTAPGDIDRSTPLILNQVNDDGAFNKLSMLVAGAKEALVYRDYHNTHDSCCYYGTYSNIYAESIKQKLIQLGSSADFERVLYTVVGQHTFSTTILDDMEALITD